MSDTPNGPGWWLASDGKWYPPQPAPTPQAAPTPASFPQPTGSVPGGSISATPPPVPNYPAPGSTPIPPAYGQYSPYGAVPEKKGTNGFAIAALTLGILWICGLGSLLAIIFGIVGLKQVKSRGQSGKGLAIAGIVLGSLGLLATIAVGFAVGSQVRVDSDEEDDVSLVSCRTQPDGTVVAELEITNDSSKPSSYIVIVDFGEAAGVSGEVTSGDIVDPGETIVWEIESTTTTSGDAECGLTYVNRLAAG